jgi:hypothetical protein
MPRLPYRNKREYTLDWFLPPRDRCQPSKPTKPYVRPVDPPVSLRETLRWLEHIKRDEWWQSQMPVSTRALDAAMGGGEVRHAHRRGGVSLLYTMNLLAFLIPDIERRAVFFPKSKKPGYSKKGEKQIMPPHFLRLEPPAVIPEIPKLCLESAWSLWAKCQACSSNKFLPVTIDEKPHVACYMCNHPSKYSYGGEVVEKSLIHPALKKYC